ncbi:MAG: N-acetyltransferase [Bacillaceae bacterium]|jgi:ribosomal protein S18 acetylase RimI-like enzyme|uniref:GNAT family N-acetyltransferase n=2 Tax=Bacillaceae TaxID=186817 RepID=A0A161W0L7_9BACI|nr:GNAT family N-acetyltransferase [Aeribacillus pallidus]KZM53437.1 acetyltransferase [Aeribacillus pallidus]REJ19236.1 MAG: N-acetyltransferase [Bacillaceae bacterium]
MDERGMEMSRYRKRFYLNNQGRNVEVVIRNYNEADFDELIEIQKESFPPPFPSELWWNKEQLTNHVTLFQEGALCVEVEGTLAGSMTSLIVNFDPAHPDHTWEEITDNGYIRNHDPNGNTLYVVDICIRPSHRKLDLGKWLMQSMYEVVVHKGLDRLLGGGRMPGYYKYADEMSAEQYVDAVVSGDLKDPVISFLLRCGRTPLGIVANYLEDEESRNYAVLMEWKNPFK